MRKLRMTRQAWSHRQVRRQKKDRPNDSRSGSAAGLRLWPRASWHAVPTLKYRGYSVALVGPQNISLSNWSLVLVSFALQFVRLRLKTFQNN